jgi:hypothetical protein
MMVPAWWGAMDTETFRPLPRLYIKEEGRGRKIEAVRFSEMQVPAPRLADRQTLPGYARARRTAPPRRAENRGGDAHGTVENR